MKELLELLGFAIVSYVLAYPFLPKSKPWSHSGGDDEHHWSQ